MAFGFTYGGTGGADFLPVVKYDARAGRVFRVDRADGVSTPHDITRNLKMVVDLENVEAGWISFQAGAAPDFQLVPLGQPFPARPSENHKQGIRLIVKLGQESGGDVRELAGTAGVFLHGVDDLHTAYLAGLKDNPGKLPVVVLKDTIPVTSGKGAKTSTNYQPVFEIVSWVARPKDLIHTPRNAPAAPQATTHSAPPSTGSTQVAPPAAKAEAPPFAMADADDFG